MAADLGGTGDDVVAFDPATGAFVVAGPMPAPAHVDENDEELTRWERELLDRKDDEARARSMAAHPAGKGRARLEDVPDPDDFELAVEDALSALGNLLVSKQRDYGPRAISDSPGGPLNGIRVRVHDKTSRLNNLLDSGREPEHESIRDTVRDLANYWVIAGMVLDGTWPK